MEKKEMVISEAAAEQQVLRLAGDILKQQAAPVWGQPEAVALICKLAVEAGLEAAAVPDFMAGLRVGGAGGNASAFAQMLVKKGMLPERGRKATLRVYA
jgi:hypothetical protein